MSSLGLILLTPVQVIRWTWIAFLVYWAVSAAGGKKTKRKESAADRLAYTLPLVVGVLLMTTRKAQSNWLGIRFVADADATRWFGAALTIAGVALAIWARKHIGTNWSGTVTLKEGHELIRTGPYARIRHPIYTGILLAGLGRAIEIGRIAGLVAVALGWASFWLKAKREESFLSEEFGAAFEVHKKQTGMFLPKLSR